MTDSNSSPNFNATNQKDSASIPVASLGPIHKNFEGQASSATPVTPTPGNKRLPAIFDNKWFVLGAIFGAMMFLGLPLLWRCPAFSWIEKLIWTIATLVYSYAVFWVFFWVMNWSWRQIQESM
ncbi:MAG: hypothetical protein U0930_20525 [Pirellulales bacterium]